MKSMLKVPSWQRSISALVGVGCLLGCIEVPVNDISVPPPPSGRDGSTDARSDGGFPSSPAWHWESPQPQGNNLRALFGIAGATSTQDVLYAAGDSGTLVISSSTGWQVQQTDFPSNRAILAIAGQGSSAQPLILAVGMFDLATRRTANQWTDLNPLLGTGDGSLTGVFATPTAGEFFVVGTTGRIFYVRGGGTTWLREALTLTTDSLFGVSGTGSASGLEVYAVGANGRVIHRAGGTWSIEAENLVAQQLNAVFCGDGVLTNEVFAAGDSGMILHKKNGAWTAETPPTSAQLTALWGSGDEIYAVGTNGTILRRQAGNWQVEGIGLTAERLSALWGTIHDGQPVVYAAGSLGTLLRREKGSWSQLSSRVTNTPLSGVWARSPSEIYAVGSDGLVLRRSGTPETGTWTPVAIGVTSNSLNAISGYTRAGSNYPDLYAVGANGTILHGDFVDGRWSVDGTALTSAELTAVWVGADIVFVVGRGGRMGKKLSGAWTPENGPGGTPVSQDLFSVWGIGQGLTQVTYVGGAAGLILRRDSSGWKQEAMGLTDQSIVSLFGTSESDLYAFGNKGAMLHRTGSGWQLESVRPLTTGASGIAGTSVPNSAELYAVGTQGLTLHYNGSTWLTEPSLTLLPASAITAASATDIIAVGANGLILHKY